MTFSEYFNALYPFLSNGDTNRETFFDEMISHFIDEKTQESCGLLLCASDTKKRYFKEKNPNKIKPEYAQYAYSKHDRKRYCDWVYERMSEQDTFDRIEDWLTNNDILFDDVAEKCDELLENIFLNIAMPNTPNGIEIPALENPSCNEEATSQSISQNDKELLNNFCIDYDIILENCISINESEVWFTGRISDKITVLNNKWKDIVSNFTDVRIQANILETIAALTDFSNFVNPDEETIPGTSIRKLQIELRNCYVKIHPEKYASIFPYEAFIDDWNDEE